MNPELTDPPPSFCDESTDLLPFFKQAVEQAVLSGQSLFVSVTIETSYSDPLAILEEIHRTNEPICYLERPSNEFSIACAEFVTEASFEGSDRFTQAKVWGDSVFKSTLIAGDHLDPGTGPTLFMTATFEDKTDSSSSPPALQVFLPRWQVLRKGGSHFVIINASVNTQTDPVRLTADFANSVQLIKGMQPDASKPKESGLVELGQPKEEFDYESAVKQALEQITSGQIFKVVLARKLTYGTSSPLNPFSIAHDLRERFPECFTFCLTTPGQGVMVGATPETLAKVSGSTLETEALAGSAPRGPSAGKDAHLGKTLLGREKEVLEHRLVIESIKRRLASIGLNDCEEGRSRLLRLANLQHVRTPLRAKFPTGVHPFDALCALHPTPAMGGTPRDSALSLVHKLEGSPRGWYSGVTGWLDSKGRGEFIVPIRCGKIMPDSLTLYAGAGLVEGSVPEQEKIETDWKLQAMLEVITGRTTLPGE
jgi:menaquinone-specific isochorismate synthase